MTAFIGSETASRLFPNLDPIGKMIYVDGREYEIVGVAKAIGTVLGQSQDNFVYLPIQSFLKFYGHDLQPVGECAVPRARSGWSRPRTRCGR